MADALYDKIADTYDATRGSDAEPLAQLVTTSLTAPTTVLDVGVGTGLTTRTLEANGHRIVGVDVSSKMLKLARRRDPTCRLARCDATRLPLPDDSITTAISVQVFQLLMEPVWLLAEIARVLRPGGRLVIAPVLVDVPDDPISRTYSDPDHLDALPGTLARVQPDLESAGFTIETVTGQPRSRTISPAAEGDRLDELWGGHPLSETLRALPNPDVEIEIDSTLTAVIAIYKPDVG